jgi:formylglycine-generating enzyme required for sulfatase activity
VVFVSWYDAIRFANWMHNGQGGPGSTEMGAYRLLGGSPTPFNGDSIVRNPGARWFVPTEDEWYKAAYFNPNAGVYYNWSTGTDAVPKNNLPSSDTGNSMNHKPMSGDYTTGNPSYPMTVAGAYQLSQSPYGTLDQGGNVYEWNESQFFGFFRGIRGGSWDGEPADYAHAAAWIIDNPSNESTYGGALGFRVATIPEPTTTLLLFTGALALLQQRRSRRSSCS